MKIFQNKHFFDIIPKEKTTPIRMCVVCKSRFPQNNLFRYQVKEGKIAPFSNNGRSFYLCESCIDDNPKKVKKILQGRYKASLQDDVDSMSKNLKEIAQNGQSSCT